MTYPQRIQRSRARGWRMPPNTVSITRPGLWGNPYKVLDHGQTEAVAAFERDLLAGKLMFKVEAVRKHLRGKNLACFCPLDRPCHGDVLLKIANDDNGEIATETDK